MARFARYLIIFSSGGAVRVLDAGSWGFVSLDGIHDSLDAAISSAGKLAGICEK